MSAYLYRYRGVPWWIDDGLTRGPGAVSPGFPEWTARNVTNAALATMREGPAPDLLAAGVAYQRDPVGCDMPLLARQSVRRGATDCKGATAAAIAAEWQATGRPPAGAIVDAAGIARTIHVRLRDRDPAADLARANGTCPGRRPWDPTCRHYRPMRHKRGQVAATVGHRGAGDASQPGPGRRFEGGALATHKDEALLHPALREALERGRAAGLPLYLNSGHRPFERQLWLWEERFRIARAAGERAPESWAAVERDWLRWGSWVAAEWAGEHGRVALAFPGASPHQDRPSRAADVGSNRATRAEVRRDQSELARIAADLVHRPIPGEPWHFEPLPGL